MYNAIVLINVERKQLKTAIDNLMNLDGVTEAYCVAGEYDIVVMIHVNEKKQLADLVQDKIPHMDCIHHTKTLFALDTHTK